MLRKLILTEMPVKNFMAALSTKSSTMEELVCTSIRVRTFIHCTIHRILLVYTLGLCDNGKYVIMIFCGILTNLFQYLISQ